MASTLFPKDPTAGLPSLPLNSLGTAPSLDPQSLGELLRWVGVVGLCGGSVLLAQRFWGDGRPEFDYGGSPESLGTQTSRSNPGEAPRSQHQGVIRLQDLPPSPPRIEGAEFSVAQTETQAETHAETRRLRLPRQSFGFPLAQASSTQPSPAPNPQAQPAVPGQSTQPLPPEALAQIPALLPGLRVPLRTPPRSSATRPPSLAAVPSTPIAEPQPPVAQPPSAQPPVAQPPSAQTPDPQAPDPRPPLQVADLLAAPDSAIAVANPSVIAASPESNRSPAPTAIGQATGQSPSNLAIATSPSDRLADTRPPSQAALPPRLPLPAATPSNTPPEGIFVDQLRISGSTAFSPQQLVAIAQAALPPASPSSSSATPLNRVLSPADLLAASDAITQHYTRQGYINSGAYVPETVLQGGPPEIKVVEGSLETIVVNIKPNRAFGLGQPLQPSYVQRRIAQAAGQPLNLNQLLDGVRQLEQDPLIDSIQTQLVPGTKTGQSILNVEVQPARTFRTALQFDNSRSPSVGSFRQQLSLEQANLLGIGDRFTASYGRTAGSNTWELGYAVPLNAKNGTLGFRYANSFGRIIEPPFDQLNIASRSRTYELHYRQPVKRTANEELALSLTGSRYSSQGTIVDGEPLPTRGSDESGRTVVTALRLGQDWTRRSDQGVFALNSVFSVGVGALGATVNDRAPDGRFLSWRGQGQYVRRLGSDALLSLRGGIQLADRPLVPSEQFALGGSETVRGYRPNAVLSDNGLLASAEVQIPLLKLPKYQAKLEVAPFFDLGYAWNSGGDAPLRSQLMSTGLGLIFRQGKSFMARLDWGFPLGAVSSDLRQSGPIFSLLWRP